jgi:hypothetical protein
MDKVRVLESPRQWTADSGRYIDSPEHWLVRGSDIDSPEDWLVKAAMWPLLDAGKLEKGSYLKSPESWLVRDRQ